ncbi:MAG: glycosyltransferase 61 family protein [Parvularcula sp.]|nr:glycosyltransferase 61 family protein [Parvularcula sp.]
MRRNTPQNWAHFLNNHMPIAFHLAEQHDIDPGRIQAILPSNSPTYILAASELFDLEVVKTDAPVEGMLLSFDVTPWRAMRSVRHSWVQTKWPHEKILEVLQGKSDCSFPKRPFLSRRDTRRISNGDEVERVLHARGFETVYAEDLSVADQFRMILQAEEIVAIHGAALAPLLYAGGGNVPSPRRIIELMPCGHMTEVYRVIATQAGSAWIGVQGRMKPSYIRPSYGVGRRFSRFSLDDFEIDPESLEIAFQMTDSESDA